MRESWGKPDPKPIKGERQKGEKKPTRLVEPGVGQRKMLRERECRACGGTYRLEAHHLVPRSQGGDDVEDNQVPLCHLCHHRFHHTGERKVIAAAIAATLTKAEAGYIVGKKGKAWAALWYSV